MNVEFPAEDPLPVDLLTATEELFRDAAADLFQARRKLRAGQAEEVHAATQAVRDLKLAFDMVMKERANVEKLRKSAAGIVHDLAIDLDAARDEIGRRLACLRDAGGGG